MTRCPNCSGPLQPMPAAPGCMLGDDCTHGCPACGWHFASDEAAGDAPHRTEDGHMSDSLRDAVRAELCEMVTWAEPGEYVDETADAIMALLANHPVEVVVDHRPGETCSVAAEVDPETGFARPDCACTPAERHVKHNYPGEYTGAKP